MGRAATDRGREDCRSGANRRTVDAPAAFSPSFNGFLTLAAGNVITVGVTSSGNTNLTVVEGHFTVERAG